MYVWIWRHLPRPFALRLLLATLLAAGVVVVLFTLVFPWLAQALPFTRVTVSG